MRHPACRTLLLLSLLGASGVHREAHAVPCAGTCATELITNPKGTQKYVKKAAAAVSKCLKSGTPACPTPCPLPDPVAFGLSEACGALLRCKLGDLADASASDAWDASGGCVLSSGARCDLQRFKHARKLAARVLAALRKGQTGKLGSLSSRCESEIGHQPGCADSGAACAAAEAVVYGLMESRYAACDGLPLTEEEMAAAVQDAIDHLAKGGMRIGPQSWHDATELFALIAQTFTEAECLGRAQTAAAPTSRTSALEDGQTLYCGPNSCTKGATGCVLADPGACLNGVCALHDDCYGRIEQSACIRRDCTWSSQTLACDGDFFVQAALCRGLGQCGFTCKAVVAAAAALTTMNVQLESGASPCPRQVGECPACPGQCQSDCTCQTTATTTTTLPSGCEFSCGDGSCVGAAIVCNGAADCPGGEDENPDVCAVETNCCVATMGCPAETGSSCGSTCCCCPVQQACCPDWSLGCCAAP